jgi:hypothetical protein
VLLTGEPAALHTAGLGPGCTAGMHLDGFAVGGSVRAPEVVTKPVTGCAAARFTVTAQVGLPLGAAP